MEETAAGSISFSQKSSAYQRSWLLSYSIFAALVVASAVAIYYVGLLDPARWRRAAPALEDVVTRMYPPDFSDRRLWIKPLYQTLAMSMAGTALAVAASIPLGILAARNATPFAFLYHPTRILLNFMRGVPDLIAAIMFVAAFGMGPLPGTLALAFHSTGVLGKFFAEIIEHTDAATIEAVRASGAGRLQVLWHGYLTLAFPQLADASVYRWECNFRNSAILGMVGAGGIGFQIYAAFTVLAYREVLALLILVLFLVTVVDLLGASLRQRIK
ncbi:MAG TPA: phosphonate ABC transporter, permease protein PhnE [Planctomycetota bacterium]|nr:phosphonate ABC transporter, permease protein PhnE [Planctomycetota bacterium]